MECRLLKNSKAILAAVKKSFLKQEVVWFEAREGKTCSCGNNEPKASLMGILIYREWSFSRLFLHCTVSCVGSIHVHGGGLFTCLICSGRISIQCSTAHLNIPKIFKQSAYAPGLFVKNVARHEGILNNVHRTISEAFNNFIVAMEKTVFNSQLFWKILKIHLWTWKHKPSLMNNITRRS